MALSLWSVFVLMDPKWSHNINLLIWYNAIFRVSRICNLEMINDDIFQSFTPNIHVGYEAVLPMFSSKNKKGMYTPLNPTFPCIKWGLPGVSLHRLVYLILYWRNIFFKKKKKQTTNYRNDLSGKYSEIPLLKQPKMSTSDLLKPLFAKFKLFFFFFIYFLHFVNLWLETTFGTVQKWSLRPLFDSPKGGLDIGILLYTTYTTL